MTTPRYSPPRYYGHIFTYQVSSLQAVFYLDNETTSLIRQIFLRPTSGLTAEAILYMNNIIILLNLFQILAWNVPRCISLLYKIYQFVIFFYGFQVNNGFLGSHPKPRRPPPRPSAPPASHSPVSTIGNGSAGINLINQLIFGLL